MRTNRAKSSPDYQATQTLGADKPPAATYSDVFLLLAMVFYEVPCGGIEILAVSLHLDDGVLDAIQQLLILTQRQQQGEKEAASWIMAAGHKAFEPQCRHGTARGLTRVPCPSRGGPSSTWGSSSPWPSQRLASPLRLPAANVLLATDTHSPGHGDLDQQHASRRPLTRHPWQRFSATTSDLEGPSSTDNSSSVSSPPWAE